MARPSFFGHPCLKPLASLHTHNNNFSILMQKQKFILLASRLFSFPVSVKTFFLLFCWKVKVRGRLDLVLSNQNRMLITLNPVKEEQRHSKIVYSTRKCLKYILFDLIQSKLFLRHPSKVSNSFIKGSLIQHSSSQPFKQQVPVDEKIIVTVNKNLLKQKFFFITNKEI